MLTEKRVDEFINEVASASPAPGGGSVSALVGALGAGLTSMVCHLTIGRKKYASVGEQMASVLRRAEDIRRELTSLVEQDTQAFTGVMAAYALPKRTEEEKARRTDAIQQEMRQATLVPLRVMELCVDGLSLAKVVTESGNSNSISDAGVGALLLHAASLGAHLNVRINLSVMNDKTFVTKTGGTAAELFRRADRLRNEIMKSVESAFEPQQS